MSERLAIRRWNEYCLVSEDESLFPKEASAVEKPFSPLVILVDRDPMTSRGIFAIHDLRELKEEEGVGLLDPLQGDAHVADMEERDGKGDDAIKSQVSREGATVLNVAFEGAFAFLDAFCHRKKKGLKVTLVGLGDVGGTVLISLFLMGEEIDEIAIYDPNEALCSRYEMEMNQNIPSREHMPRVTIAREEDLFDCDLFLFTASRGVPPLTSKGDVRMAQLEANAQMIEPYAKRAAACGYKGLFCQISDPVDLLSRKVFLSAEGHLLPEQIQGFGLGVMAGRARYFAAKRELDLERVRVYGPHGAGLVVANDPVSYDDALSRELTELAATANIRVRELGFKPYIAPGISSAATSILRMIRGEKYLSTTPIGGVYFGCAHTMTDKGIVISREEKDEALRRRIEKVWSELAEEGERLGVLN